MPAGVFHRARRAPDRAPRSRCTERVRQTYGVRGLLTKSKLLGASKMADKPVLNIADAPLKEQGHGERFHVNWGRIGPLIGMTGMGCALHVVPPGKRAFPFHAHHVSDEMFFILSGEGEYRFGEQTFAIKAGDVL